MPAAMKKTSVMKGMKKLNPYFEKMLAAKRDKLESFEYNGNTYIGSKHDKLGMIYKKKV